MKVVAKVFFSCITKKCYGFKVLKNDGRKKDTFPKKKEMNSKCRSEYIGGV